MYVAGIKREEIQRESERRKKRETFHRESTSEMRSDSTSLSLSLPSLPLCICLCAGDQQPYIDVA
jgi:hypothetical protein